MANNRNRKIKRVIVYDLDEEIDTINRTINLPVFLAQVANEHVKSRKMTEKITFSSYISDLMRADLEGKGLL